MKTTIGSRQGLVPVLCTEQVYIYNATLVKDALALTYVSEPVGFFHTLLFANSSTDTSSNDAVFGLLNLNSIIDLRSIRNRFNQSISPSFIDFSKNIYRCLNDLRTRFFRVPDFRINR